MSLIAQGDPVFGQCPEIRLSPSALPNAAAGAPYSVVIKASGGTAHYGFAVTSGTLPPGLALSSAGVLSGTPTAGGTFTVTATDADGFQGTRSYTLTLGGGCPPVTVSPDTLPSGRQNEAYSQTLTASGGAAPYSFEITSGILPGGLTLAGDGVLSGTPTNNGNFTFIVTATDAARCAGTKTFTLVVEGCPNALIAPDTLPDGQVSQPYTQQLTISAGMPPIVFTVSAGAPPDGVGLSTDGFLNGTPTRAGDFFFTVRVTDAFNCVKEKDYVVTILVVCPTPITLMPDRLPNAPTNEPYGQTLTADGGTPPYTFALEPGLGTLPDGLTLSPDGVIGGTTTVDSAVTFTFTVRATDAAGCFGTKQFTILAGCSPISISPDTLPDGRPGVAYEQTLTAADAPGRTQPKTKRENLYTFTLAPGSGPLPEGITLSSAGVLSGTPVQDETVTFTVRVTHLNGCYDEKTYTLVIRNPDQQRPGKRKP